MRIPAAHDVWCLDPRADSFQKETLRKVYACTKKPLGAPPTQDSIFKISPVKRAPSLRCLGGINVVLKMMVRRLFQYEQQRRQGGLDIGHVAF